MLLLDKWFKMLVVGTQVMLLQGQGYELYVLNSLLVRLTKWNRSRKIYSPIWQKTENKHKCFWRFVKEDKSSKMLVYYCFHISTNRQKCLTACVLLFPCFSVDWWVHFPRSVPAGIVLWLRIKAHWGIPAPAESASVWNTLSQFDFLCVKDDTYLGVCISWSGNVYLNYGKLSAHCCFTVHYQQEFLVWKHAFHCMLSLQCFFKTALLLYVYKIGRHISIFGEAALLKLICYCIFDMCCINTHR